LADRVVLIQVEEKNQKRKKIKVKRIKKAGGAERREENLKKADSFLLIFLKKDAINIKQAKGLLIKKIVKKIKIVIMKLGVPQEHFVIINPINLRKIKNKKRKERVKENK